mmetsp:Transcript_13734/g.20424  ORF Transcript_13734/g.20424 Transcript_13734/m.20424 type:complete len:373 (-) Transcript_13734:15-1133(-)
MVMAGTGDLDSLRAFREMRWKVDSSVPYGSHMALGEAIGLLFLQGGMATLKRDNLSVAALISSFFPRFPGSTSDNKYHLQALRHVYALAVEKRCVESVDAVSNEPVSVSLEIKGKWGVYIRKTPCTLPPFDAIHTIKVLDEDLMPLSMDLKDDVFLQKCLQYTQKIYTKRRPKASAKLEGAHGGALLESFPSKFKEIFAGKNDPLIDVVGVDNFIGLLGHIGTTGAAKLDEKFYAAVYAESMKRGRENCVSVYLGVVRLICRLKKFAETSSASKDGFGVVSEVVLNLKLIVLYFEKMVPLLREKFALYEPCLDECFVGALRMEVEEILASNDRLRSLYVFGGVEGVEEEKFADMAILVKMGKFDEVMERMEF